MAERTPRRRLAGVLIVAAVLTAGCNPALLVSLMMGPAKQQPTLAKLTPPAEKEQARVVIIASAPINTGVDFARIDRDIASAVGRHLQLGYDKNKEKIQIIPARKVEKFKDDHTDWYTMDKAEIGNLFHADYVIVLEIESIDLYERGSNRLMLHGQTSIGVSLVDMKRPEDEPVKTQFVAEFPTKSRGPVQVEEVNLQQFRHDFLESIAKKLAWHFVEHETEQEDF